MNKTELYAAMTTDLNEIIKTHKMPAKAVEAVEALLVTYIKPKTSSSSHPPLENGDLYCRLTEKYYPKEDMVISKGKSKGYSKAGIAIWNKSQRVIQKMTSEFVDLGDFDSKKSIKLKADIDNLKAMAKGSAHFIDGSLEKYLANH